MRGQTGGTIEGRVVNSATGAGIGGVAVTLWAPQGTNYHVTTDESGSWHVTDIKPGQYDSRFEKDGFTQPPGATPWPASPLRVGAAGNPIRLDTTLTPLATLRGRVVDPEGKPAADVEVGLNAFQSTRTDSEGQFALTQLKPGSYALVAKARPPKEPPPDHNQIVATYYPSAVERSQAGKVEIRGGEELSGFEIRLRASPVFRVRGVVLDEFGKPMAEATVRLLARQDEMTFAGQMMMGNLRYFIGAPREVNETSAQSNKDGTFEFATVIPGDWLLRAESEPKRDSRQRLSLSWSAEVPVTVSDHDPGDLEVRFAPTFTLQASIDWGDRPPPDTNRMGSGALFLISLDSRQLNMPHFAEPGDTLRFENIAAGRYRIVPLAGFPAGYYPASVTIGGQEVMGQPVELNAATPALRISYRPNAGTVRGTVEKGGGATVLVWPQASAAIDMVRAVQANSAGGFEFGNIPPGDYFVLAVDRPNLETQTEASLRSIMAAATRVTVDENAVLNVPLNVTHLPE